MDIYKVNRVGSDGSSYIVEAGILNENNMLNNINQILKFAILVRESLNKILSVGIRMGIHGGSCIAGLVHNTHQIPSFSLFGEMIYSVKLVESKCDIGSILISESVLNYLEKSTIEFNENISISDRTRSIKTYLFNEFKQVKNYDSLISQVECKFKKIKPTNDYDSSVFLDIRKSKSINDNSSEISDVSFSVM
jgi:hypothetical protein